MLQNYVRNLVNFDISVVGHLDNFDKMQSYLDQGDNVVCLANHQTEADPGTKFRSCRPRFETSTPSHKWQPFDLAVPGMSTDCNSSCLDERATKSGLADAGAHCGVMLRA